MEASATTRSRPFSASETSARCGQITNGRHGIKASGLKILFWEQRVGSQFSFRVGNQGPQAVYNFFRFKDARTSFTTSAFTFQETIPYPTFGLGASFRWLPIGDAGLYVVGTLNDMNGDPAALGIDWSTFRLGQYFYGLEIGNDWRSPDGTFDHLHLDLFYADKRSTRNPDTTPNEAAEVSSWPARNRSIASSALPATPIIRRRAAAYRRRFQGKPPMRAWRISVLSTCRARSGSAPCGISPCPICFRASAGKTSTVWSRIGTCWSRQILR